MEGEIKILRAELNFQRHEDNTKTNLTSYMIWSKIIDKDQMRSFKQCKTQLIVSLYNRYHFYYDG